MSTTIEAGNLTSEHVGRKVSVTWKKDLITSTVTDKLEQITHRGRSVTLYFERTKWLSSALITGTHDDGLTVNFEDVVTIEEVSA
uniref:hypothetical protein n=1 Tax=Microbacterium proteolyticum TaxID=1572644 RepID=UPI002417E4EB|nr:hypothetical protein [Microbacterium proteolyticum]